MCYLVKDPSDGTFCLRNEEGSIRTRWQLSIKALFPYKIRHYPYRSCVALQSTIIIATFTSIPTLTELEINYPELFI